MFSLDDNKKIGTFLVVVGLGFVFLGVLLLFDRALLALGNILFLVGGVFIAGIKWVAAALMRRGVGGAAAGCSRASRRPAGPSRVRGEERRVPGGSARF